MLSGLLAFFYLAVLGVSAQEIHPSPPPAPAAAPAPATPAAPIPGPTIVTRTDLVNMIFAVQDKHGAFVPHLTRSDFRVLEDGKPQPIQFFAAETQLPLTLGLLLDTSPSQARVLGLEQEVSDNFFHQVLTPHDLAFVIGFDVNVQLLQDMTPSAARLSAAVDHAHIGGGEPTDAFGNAGPFPTHGSGATHLWDAIYLACHDELAHQAGRKAIIIVTDGGEQGSTYTEQDALRAALDSNTIVFAVLASDGSAYGVFGAGPGPGQLRKMAEQTGGRSINAGKNIGKAFQQIAQELRSQYSLGFRPLQPSAPRQTTATSPGTFHTVKIELIGDAAPKDAKVRARSGFYEP